LTLVVDAGAGITVGVALALNLDDRVEAGDEGDAQDGGGEETHVWTPESCRARPPDARVIAVKSPAGNDTDLPLQALLRHLCLSSEEAALLLDLCHAGVISDHLSPARSRRKRLEQLVGDLQGALHATAQAVYEAQGWAREKAFLTYNFKLTP
jgi:hypothetical protein